MNIVTKVSEWQSIRKTLSGKDIGFVPTMGNLHAGHMHLCEESRRNNELTVVSIFVNQTQFNQQSDFDKYPRTAAEDVRLLESHNIDYVFMPTMAEMYPDGYEVRVSETSISQELEGKYRPGHFEGMLTVVMKLLNLVAPARAYFGEKDYQQLLLVQKMVQALFMPVEIIGCKTVRAEDELALSSRNSRLDKAERKQAAQLPRLLRLDDHPDEIASKLEASGFRVDYVAEKWGRRLVAAWLGDVRLIDNIKR